MKVDAKGNPEVGGSPQGNDQGRSIQKHQMAVTLLEVIRIIFQIS